MYDVNPHLSNQEVAAPLQGGAHSCASDGSTSSIKMQRVQTAIGCILVSLLAMYASTTSERGATTVGLALIALMSAMSAFYLGTLLLPSEPSEQSKTAERASLASFVLLSATILCGLSARSILVLLYYR